MSGEVQDIPTPPFDGTPGGLVSWLLGILCGIIAFLWKLNEGKNGAAIVDIQRRLTESETQHKVCQDDRHELATELAVNKAQLALNSERLNQLEKKLVQGTDQ